MHRKGSFSSFSVQILVSLHQNILNMERNPLIDFGAIPLRKDTIAACFGDLSSPEKKVLALEKDGQLIRLKRGLYVVSSDVTGKPIDARLCANHIYGPSYVSLHWALRWYGLIPERVHQMTSVTTKRSRDFVTPIGNFSFYQVAKDYYPIGIRIVQENGTSCMMASPEKALCDLILYDNYVPHQSQKALWAYLEEDIRLDTDELKNFDTSIIEACANTGIKVNILNNLIKIIKKL